MKNIKYLLLMSSSILFLFPRVSYSSVCSIVNPNCSGNGSGGFSDNDYGLDIEQICFGKDYNLTSCPSGQNPQNFCPEDSKYFSSCKCPSEFQYTASSCAVEFPNSVLGLEQCSSDSVTYSNSCVCDTVKYPYTTSNCTGNESLSGTICKSSNGITYGASCICTPTAGKCSGYNLSSNNCTGGYSIGESCHDGCNTKWRCKDLCPNEGTLSSCPNGYVCTLEECSSKFYITGCAVNYKNYCTRPTTDCAALGYTKTADECTGDAVRCPYDSTKMTCIESCKIGSILYSDKSCSKTVKSGKTAIAVVFDKDKKLAVALADAGSTMYWGGYETDIPSLASCSGGTQLTCGVDGKSNTSAIIDYGKANGISYPAAEYCASYNTSGTEAGDWFLPSFADLQSIYNAKTYVNASLQLLGKPALTESTYLSSTEYGYISSWILTMYDGNIGDYGKNYGGYVRAVVAF